MRTIKYEEQDKNTGNTENHIATDESMEKKFGNLQYAYDEGFAASDGVRGETAETDGRVQHPEKGDESRPKRPDGSIENENPGLADN